MSDCPWVGTSKEKDCPVAKNAPANCPYMKSCLSLLPRFEQQAFLNKNKQSEKSISSQELLDNLLKSGKHLS
jgi:hypothetical protein